MNMLLQVFMWTYVFFFLLDKYLGVQLMGHCWLILEEIQNRFQNVCTILNFFFVKDLYKVFYTLLSSFLSLFRWKLRLQI